MLLSSWLACAQVTPCAAGFGRNRMGECVPIGGSADTDEVDTDEADTDTGETAPDSDSGGDTERTDSPVDTGPDLDGDGWTEAAGDCDDDDPARYPNALDRLGDGVDADCDGRDEPDDGVGGDQGSWLGATVAVVGDQLIVGAPLWSGEGVTHGGAVTVLDWDGGLRAVTSFSYSVSEERHATAVRSLGDLDGDGFPDVAVASPYVAVTHPTTGEVQLFLGPLSESATPVATLYGDATEAHAGWSVDGGDVDGDGQIDVVVGGTQAEWGSADDPVGAGKAYVWSGDLAGDHDLGDALIIEGESLGHYFGYQVRVIQGADGFGTVFVGAVLTDPRGADNAGSVYAFRDPVDGMAAADADAVLQGEDNDVEVQGDRCGWGLDSAGDFDGDGVDDVIIGCPQGSIPDHATAGNGRLYVVSGAVEGTIGLEEAPFIVEGEAFGDRFGMDVAGGFDCNGDGAADLWVGAPQRDSLAGAAYLILGPASGSWSAEDVAQVVLGADDIDALGWGVAGGDLDGDGLDDLVAGAPGDDDQSGLVQVILGTGVW